MDNSETNQIIYVEQAWNQLKKNLKKFIENISDVNEYNELVLLIQAQINQITNLLLNKPVDSISKEKSINIEAKIAHIKILLNNDISLDLVKEIFSLLNKIYSHLDSNETQDFLKISNNFNEEIISTVSAINAIKSKTDSLSTEINTMSNELSTLSRVLFGDEYDFTKKSLLTEIQEKRNELEDLFETIKQYEIVQKSVIEELNRESKSTLEKSTNAGLASAFYEEKKSASEKVDRYTTIFTQTVWTIFCIVLISTIFGIFTDFSLLRLDNWDSILKGLMIKIGIISPLVYAAIFANRRRSEYHRLEQEYAHKETMAKSYLSFKDQVDKLGSGNEEKQMLEKLLSCSIETIGYNAASTLDSNKHKEDMPVAEILEKFAEAITKVKRN